MRLDSCFRRNDTGKGRPVGSPLLVVTRQRRIRRYIKGRGNLAPTACCAATMDLGTDEGVCPTDYGSIFIIGASFLGRTPLRFWAQSASGGCPYHSVTVRLPRRLASGGLLAMTYIGARCPYRGSWIPASLIRSGTGWAGMTRGRKALRPIIFDAEAKAR
jgi:hypothetical protein